MTIATPLMLFATFGAVGSAAVAAPSRHNSTAAYRVAYRGAGDVYCIRFYADGQAADPRPGRPAAACRSRSTWAKAGVAIHDPVRDGPAATTR